MLLVERNKNDSEMLNLHSIRGGKYILWGVVHEDMLSELSEVYMCQFDDQGKKIHLDNIVKKHG